MNKRSMMRWGAIAAGVVGVSSLGVADNIRVPAGWVADSDASLTLTAKLSALPHFGGAVAVVDAHAYRAPDGGALYVTRITARVAADQRDRAAASELDELRATAARASKLPIRTWARKALDPTTLEARAEWEADGIGTESRMVIASDQTRMTAVIGECLIRNDAPRPVADQCRSALATLDPEIAKDQRVPLALAPEPPAAPTMTLPSASITDGSKISLPPLPIPVATAPPREPDRRPIYVGLGLVILAAVFWWNRRRRDQLERAEAGLTKGTPRDEDADELHASAEDKS